MKAVNGYEMNVAVVVAGPGGATVARELSIRGKPVSKEMTFNKPAVFDMGVMEEARRSYIKWKSFINRWISHLF